MKSQEQNKSKEKMLLHSLGTEIAWKISSGLLNWKAMKYFYRFFAEAFMKSQEKKSMQEENLLQTGHWKAMKYFYSFFC